MNATSRLHGRSAAGRCTLLLAGLLAAAPPLTAQPWAPGQQSSRDEAMAAEQLRREPTSPEQRRRYLSAAHAWLGSF